VKIGPMMMAESVVSTARAGAMRSTRRPTNEIRLLHLNKLPVTKKPLKAKKSARTVAFTMRKWPATSIARSSPSVTFALCRQMIAAASAIRM